MKEKMQKPSHASTARMQMTRVRNSWELIDFRIKGGAGAADPVVPEASWDLWVVNRAADLARFRASGLAGTSAGSVRTATEGNCYCYYWDCDMRCCWGWHTAPCLREDPDSACRTEEQCYCQRLRAGTRWVEAARVVGAVQAHRQPVSFVRRLELLLGAHPRENAADDQHVAAHRQPCVAPLPPSSSPSILCESP